MDTWAHARLSVQREVLSTRVSCGMLMFGACHACHSHSLCAGMCWSLARFGEEGLGSFSINSCILVSSTSERSSTVSAVSSLA